jgi:hypothetical protein
LRDTFTTDQYATEGVIPGVLNQLGVTGTSSPLAVGTGSAYVYGFFYNNTASVNVAVSTPAGGTTGHRIVLRASWAAQTVRIALKSSADGTSSIPALTQTAGTTWEISLATLTITTGGTITVTDARDYIHPNMAMLYRRQGGSSTVFSTAGTTNYTPGAVRMQAGAISVSYSSSATSNLATVTFPTAFSAAPMVWLTVFSNASTTGRKMIASVETVSATQVAIRGAIANGDTTSSSFDVYWLAIGSK